MQKPQAVSGTFLNLKSSFPGGCPTDLEASIRALRRTQRPHPLLAASCTPKDTQTQERPEAGCSLPGAVPAGHQVSLFIQQVSSALYSDPKVPVRGISLSPAIGKQPK